MRIFAQFHARRQTAWSLFDQALVSLGNFAAGMILARILEITEFGRFALVMAVIVMIQAFIGYYVTVPMMTLAGRLRVGRSRYFRSTLTLNTIAAVAGAVIVAACVLAIFAARDGTILLATAIASGAAVFAAAIQENIRRSFFAEGYPQVGIISDLIRYGAYAPLLSLLPSAILRPDHIAALAVLAGVSLVASAPFIGGRMKGSASRLATIVFARQHWRISRWLLPAVPLGAAQDQLLVLFSGYMLGDSAAAAWRATQYLLGLVNPCLLAIENFVPTEAARAMRDGGGGALRRYLFRQFFLMGALIYSVLLIIAATPDFWLVLFFGSGFGGNGLVVRLYAAAFAIMFLRTMLFQFFRATENTRPLFLANIVGAFVSVTTAYPMAKLFGLPGLVSCVVAAQGSACTVLIIIILVACRVEVETER